MRVHVSANAASRAARSKSCAPRGLGFGFVAGEFGEAICEGVDDAKLHT
jgi:hypothetical protein